MYIIQEIQTTGGVTALLPAIQKESLFEAESVYHQVMAAAAISSVDIHTCVVYDTFGTNVTPGKSYYDHTEPDPPDRGSEE